MQIPIFMKNSSFSQNEKREAGLSQPLPSIKPKYWLSLTLQRVGGATLVSLDVEEALVGFEERSEAGASQADLLEDHRRGDYLSIGEEPRKLGLDLLVGEFWQGTTGALSSRSSLGGFWGLGTICGEAEAGEHRVHLLQFLGILLVNGSDLFSDFLFDRRFGFEHLLGGFLLQGGELLDEVEG